MSEIYFTESHEWIAVDGGIGTIGITPYAAEQLGDVVYVEMPETGKQVSAGGQIAVVESVKAASEIYAPVGGEVTDVNAALVAEPGQVNFDAQGAGWFFKLKLADAGELKKLMTKDQYTDFVKGL